MPRVSVCMYGKYYCNRIGDVGRFVGQNSKQLSHYTQYTYNSKTYHVMTSYINTHLAYAVTFAMQVLTSTYYYNYNYNKGV